MALIKLGPIYSCYLASPFQDLHKCFELSELTLQKVIYISVSSFAQQDPFSSTVINIYHATAT